MALPAVADLKSYLRIEHTAEDTLLTALLARARAMLELWIDTPIVAEPQTYVDRTESVIAAIYSAPVTSLVFPKRDLTNVSILDNTNATVDPTTYTVDGRTGVIYGTPGVTFPDGPYTITATTGLSNRPDYARLEPLLSELIIDLAADLYQRRTPGAHSEQAAGTTVQWDVSRETVARVMKSLRALKLGVMQ